MAHAAMLLAVGARFTGMDYRLAAPMILLTLFALGILCLDLFLSPAHKHFSSIPALAGLFVAGLATREIQRVLPQNGETLRAFFGAIIMDPLGVYFFYLFLVGAALAVLISIRYLEIERESHGEFYALLLGCVVGMMCMAAGNDFVLLFMGLELMAISSYILVGFLRGNKRSNEAALKYLLLGAFSSAIFAYGLSLFYGVSGSTNLTVISHTLAERASGGKLDPISTLALLMVLTGMLFKIAAVPFHMWAPDVYEGAPTSVTGFMSVSVKAAGWAMLLRVLLFGLAPLRPYYVPVLVFAAVVTLITGNIAALTQHNLKRLLAYSSIAHVGYMLLGLVASDGLTNRTGIKAILVYLLAYTFMNFGAFTVLTSLRRRNIVGDDIEDIAGLMQKAPVEASFMLIFLLSLAGIPPFAGFYGKYFIFLSLIETGHYTLAAVAVLFAVVGLYYYLRIANAMFISAPANEVPPATPPSLNLALYFCAAATVIIGLFPNVFLQAVDWSVTVLAPSGLALLR